MDKLPVLRGSPSNPPVLATYVEIPYNEIEPYKFYGVWQSRNGWNNPYEDGYSLVQVLRKQPSDMGGSVEVQRFYGYNYATNTWEKYGGNYWVGTGSSFKFLIPKKGLENITVNKAKVQAVKDVLTTKNVPATMSSGPLGNILGYAGISAPPKGSQAGRRKKTIRHRRKRTRRSRKHSSTYTN